MGYAHGLGRMRERTEFWDHISDDEQPNAGKSWNDWKPPNLFGHSFVENWMKLRFGIHVYICASASLAECGPRNFCARFEAPPKGFFTEYGGIPSDPNGECRVSYKGGSGKRKAVLVPVVDFLQLQEQERFRPLPTVVRLQSLNSCAYAPCDTRHVAPVSTFLDDRELNCLLLGLFHGSGHREHEEVQGRTQVVGGVTNLEIEQQREGVNIGDRHSEAPLTVLLSRESVKVRLQENMSRVVGIFQVFIRTPDLPNDRIQCIWHEIESIRERRQPVGPTQIEDPKGRGNSDPVAGGVPSQPPEGQA
jgi:hypothetical protein